MEPPCLGKATRAAGAADLSSNQKIRHRWHCGACTLFNRAAGKAMPAVTFDGSVCIKRTHHPLIRIHFNKIQRHRRGGGDGVGSVTYLLVYATCFLFFLVLAYCDTSGKVCLFRQDEQECPGDLHFPDNESPGKKMLCPLTYGPTKVWRCPRIWLDS